MAHGTCTACGRNGRVRRGWCDRCYQRWQAHGDPLWQPLRLDPDQYDSSGHKLYLKTCPGCDGTFRLRSDQTHCSTACALKAKPRSGPVRSGEDNHNWRGEDVGYHGMHIRVRKQRGKADHCERCGASDPALNYDWASLVDNPRSVDDFAPMCRSCHRKFDAERDRQRPGWQGPRNGRRKLTADIVREARRRSAAGVTFEDLAAEYGVHKETMRRVLSGVTWTWVK